MERYILMFVMLCVSVVLQAQILSGFNNIKSSNQQIIETAINGAVLEMHQSYVLCDTISGELLGRNGADFNKMTSIAFATNRGLIITDAVVKPWNVDNDFEEYSSSYKPIRRADVKSVVIGTKDTIDIHIPDSIINIVNNQLYIANVSMEGLSADTIAGNKDGWMIWILSDETGGISPLVIKKNINTSLSIIDTPNTDKKVIAGIYITPQKMHLGIMNFLFTGIAVKYTNGFQLYCPFIASKENNKSKLTTIISQKYKI